jgi:hypothetical protein
MAPLMRNYANIGRIHWILVIFRMTTLDGHCFCMFLPIFTNIFLHPEDLMARDLLQSRCTDAMGQTEWRDSAIVEAGMRHPPLT